MRKKILCVSLLILLVIMTGCNGSEMPKKSSETENSISITEPEDSEKYTASEQNSKTSEIKEENDNEKEQSDPSSNFTTNEDDSEVKQKPVSESETPSSESQTLKIEDVSKVLIAKKSVNVRKEPSSKSDKLGALKEGTSVDVSGLSDNGWYRIDYMGQSAFVAQSYLIEQEEYNELKKKEEQPETPETVTPSEPTSTSEVVPSESTVQSNASDDEYRNAVLNLINQRRSESGLSGLSQSSELTQAATVRASEVSTSFSHTRPDGTSCFTILDNNGVAYNAAGENIAAGQPTPDDVMSAWMNSQGHRDNIMSPNFNKVGIGICRTSDGYSIYWVQLFTD